MSMGNLVDMYMYVLYMCRCMHTCVDIMCRCMHTCVDMYMCVNFMFHEYDCFMYVHILRLHVLYDYVQRCDDIDNVELLYIN